MPPAPPCLPACAGVPAAVTVAVDSGADALTVKFDSYPLLRDDDTFKFRLYSLADRANPIRADTLVRSAPVAGSIQGLRSGSAPRRPPAKGASAAAAQDSAPAAPSHSCRTDISGDLTEQGARSFTIQRAAALAYRAAPPGGYYVTVQPIRKLPDSTWLQTATWSALPAEGSFATLGATAWVWARPVPLLPACCMPAARRLPATAAPAEQSPASTSAAFLCRRTAQHGGSHCAAERGWPPGHGEHLGAEKCAGFGVHQRCIVCTPLHTTRHHWLCPNGCRHCLCPPAPSRQFTYPEAAGSTPATHWVLKYWPIGAGAAEQTSEVTLGASQFGAASGGSYPVTLSALGVPGTLRGRYAVTVAAKSAADTSGDSSNSNVFAIGALLASGDRFSLLGAGGRQGHSPHTHAVHALPPVHCAAPGPCIAATRRPARRPPRCRRPLGAAHGQRGTRRRGPHCHLRLGCHAPHL